MSFFPPARNIPVTWSPYFDMLPVTYLDNRWMCREVGWDMSFFQTIEFSSLSKCFTIKLYIVIKGKEKWIQGFPVRLMLYCQNNYRQGKESWAHWWCPAIKIFIAVIVFENKVSSPITYIHLMPEQPASFSTTRCARTVRILNILIHTELNCSADY